MYKVFLVDDEIAAREAVRASVPWGELGMQLAGETADGELALALLREARPDVLITDLRMPFMDGLELCRRVRRELPDTRIVIVSACTDFSCAREAVALGARAYLPKPLDARELRKTLEDIAEELRGEALRREREAALEAYLRSAGNYFQERLLEELYGGVDAQTVLRSARAVRLDLSARCYQVILLRPEEPLREPALLELHGALEQIAQSSGGTAFLRRGGACFSLLVLGDDARHLGVRAQALVEAARGGARRALGATLAVEFGEAVAQLRDVPASFAGAKARMEQRCGLARDAEDGREPWKLPALDLPPLLEQLRYAAPGDAQRIVAGRAEALGALNSRLLADYLCADVLLAAARIVRDCQGELASVAPEALRLRERGEGALSLCGDVLRKALEFRDERGSTRYGAVIRRALAYIDAHCADSGLALKDVAAHVALSNNHFCTVFAREMGVTFSEYLTGLRIRRAKELLRDTNLRTGEIAYQVGYNDPHYFSNLFKKKTGVSPREFRQKESVKERK